MSKSVRIAFLLICICTFFSACVLFPVETTWSGGDSCEIVNNEYITVKLVKHTDKYQRQTISFEATNNKDYEFEFSVSSIKINVVSSESDNHGSKQLAMRLSPGETAVFDGGIDFSSISADSVKEIVSLDFIIGAGKETDKGQEFVQSYKIRLEDESIINLHDAGWTSENLS